MQIKYGNKKVGKNKKYRKKKAQKNIHNNPKITGIIVCVDFSVFLKETLPYSKNILNDLYVVTSDDDNETKKLCKKTDTKCLSIPRTIPTLLKGIYINHAFDNIPNKDWFLITDADIVLPSKKIFDVSQINEKPRCLYGVYCQFCKNYEEWIDYKKNNTQYNWKVKARTTHVGMGAFQLFHTSHFERKGFRYPPYTIKNIGRKYKAKGADYTFAKKFPCKHKLPFNVLHLSNKKNIKNMRTRQYQDIEDLTFI